MEKYLGCGMSVLIWSNNLIVLVTYINKGKVHGIWIIQVYLSELVELYLLSNFIYVFRKIR